MVRSGFTIQAPHSAGGYYAQTRNRKPEELTTPSINLRYTRDGAATTRKGYEDTAWDLSEANSPATAEHVERFNVSFFAAGTTLKYVDHNNSDAVVDTGITLTDGTSSWMGEYNGDLYLTNTTDGLYRIVLTRLNGDVTAGDASIIVDKDGAARLSVFSKTSGNLRINGINEAYNAVTVSTGTITLSGTSTASYDDNATAIVAYAISAAPKGSKFVFWKETMNMIGVGDNEADGSTDLGDIPATTMYYSDFTTAATSENIIDFAGGGYEMVGKSGVLKNIEATKDFLYLFKEDQTYYISIQDVNIVSGARPPQIFSANYGCVNEHCAAVMGDVIVWLSPQKRIIKSDIRVENGTASLYPDESFDAPLKEILNLMDDDQDDARVWYQKKSKELHVKVRIDGEIVELVYDNDKGIWCPPDTNKYINSYFEIKGEPYGTSDNDDTIYKLDSSTSDDGADIECIIAYGEFESEDGRTTMDLGKIGVSGSLTQVTEITYAPKMNGINGTEHLIDDRDSTLDEAEALGEFVISDNVLNSGETTVEEADYDWKLANYPAKTQTWQPIFKSFGDGDGFSIKSWTLRGSKAYSSSILTTR